MHMYMDGKTEHCALIQTNRGNTVYCSYRKSNASDLCGFFTFTHCGFL